MTARCMTARKLPPPRVSQAPAKPLRTSFGDQLTRWRAEHDDLERAADAAGEAVEAVSRATQVLYDEAMVAFEKFQRSGEQHDDARAAFQATVEAVERHWKLHPLEERR